MGRLYPALLVVLLVGCHGSKAPLNNAQPSSAAGSTAEPAPGSHVKEMLSLADMFEVVLAEKPGLVNCVKEQRSQNPDTSGTLKVRWTIQASGQTSDVSVVSEELKDTVMARCVVSLVKGLKFPEHEKQGEPVVFPFKF